MLMVAFSWIILMCVVFLNFTIITIIIIIIICFDWFCPILNSTKFLKTCTERVKYMSAKRGQSDHHYLDLTFTENADKSK